MSTNAVHANMSLRSSNLCRHRICKNVPSVERDLSKGLSAQVLQYFLKAPDFMKQTIGLTHTKSPPKPTNLIPSLQIQRMHRPGVHQMQNPMRRLQSLQKKARMHPPILTEHCTSCPDGSRIRSFLIHRAIHRHAFFTRKALCHFFRAVR